MYFPLIAAALVLVSSIATPQDSAPDASARRAVLVTGASSGIGRKTTELLASNGFFVYAGARKEEDLKALDAIPNVKSIRLDVTKPADIEAAVKTVSDGGRGLYGLVNNAGVVVVAPLVEVREDDLAFQMDANVYGPVRMTKAFAPLLIESKGRVVTTGSISGFATWPMGGPYTMSKHAIEAFTDVLALELAPFGVAVSVVEPGNYRSEIFANMRRRLIDQGYTGKGSLYEGQMTALMNRPTDRGEFKEPDEVAEVFLRALTDASPRRRYMVVPNANEAALTLKAAIARVVELNGSQPYALDREGLIKLLDEALRRR
jgi:NAD(P)-dependent dehydrogenase (short-subunit alcohol dehydrogenase family)